MDTITLEKPLSTKELSEFLGVLVRTLEDWRTRHYGPAYWYAGKTVRYSPSDVRDWTASQRGAA